MTIFSYTPSQIAALLLIFVRIGGIIFTAPVFSNFRVPIYIRAGISLVFTFLLQPVVAPAGTPASASLSLFSLYIIKEAVIGIVIGYTANLIFSTVQVAGELQDTQAGYGFAGAVDPNADHGSAILGQFQMVLMWLIFLILNGHHILLYGMAQCFSAVPIGGFAFHGALTEHIFNMTVTLLLVALKIGAPIIGAVLLSDLALGILQRTAPQLNLMAIGFQVKTTVAVIVLILALPFIIMMQGGLVHYMGTMMEEVLKLSR